MDIARGAQGVRDEKRSRDLRHRRRHGLSSSSLLLSSLEFSDTQVDEPYIRALFGTASHFCEGLEVLLEYVSPAGLKAFALQNARETFATVAAMVRIYSYICMYRYI